MFWKAWTASSTCRLVFSVIYRIHKHSQSENRETEHTGLCMSTNINRCKKNFHKFGCFILCRKLYWLRWSLINRYHCKSSATKDNSFECSITFTAGCKKQQKNKPCTQREVKHALVELHFLHRIENFLILPSYFLIIVDYEGCCTFIEQCPNFRIPFSLKHSCCCVLLLALTEATWEN